MADLNIQRDAKVMASDGELGQVKHVVIDPQTKELTHMVVEGKHGQSMVPINAVKSVEGDRVTLNGAGAQFMGTRFEQDQYHAIDEREVRAKTERIATHGGAPVVDAKKDELEIAGKQQRAPMREPAMPARGAEGYRLQLREEHLRANTVREQAGEVKLGKKVTEHQETVSVPVTEERVIIERTTVTNGTAARGEIGKGETIEVPVMKERVTVEKETMVREEVGVRKESVLHTERVQDTVRSEELEVKAGKGLVSEARDSTTAREPRRTDR